MLRSRSWVAVFVSACLSGALQSAPSLAQSTTGTIQGIVRDGQGAVIPGATVTVRNVQTGQVRSAPSGDEGQYRFPNLQVGEYALTVELVGFGTFQQAGLNLTLNQVAVIDIVLQPAGLAEAVQVTADTPLLNTTNSEVGVRFDTRRVAELPVINSRDVFSLASAAPASSSTTTTASTPETTSTRQPAATRHRSIVSSSGAAPSASRSCATARSSSGRTRTGRSGSSVRARR